MNFAEELQSATCWRCGTRVSAARLEVEAVLRTRPQADGGPYLLWGCASCGEDAGALRNAAGAWLLHPLEGLTEPGLIERLVPRTTRAALDAAVRWWRRNASRVERFRRVTCHPGDTPPRTPPRRGTSARPPRPPPGGPDPAPAPEPPRAEPPSAPEWTTGPEARTPRELLGVAAGADAETIRRAYRRALKLCHPDRVANLDPEIQAFAHRKAKALRTAYEQLLAEADGGL